MQWKFELLLKPSAIPLTEGPVWDGEYLYFTHIREEDPNSFAAMIRKAHYAAS